METEQRDFYYSAKMNAVIKRNIRMMLPEKRMVISKFRGEVYNETTLKGEKCASNYDDLVKIGTGTYAECSYT